MYESPTEIIRKVGGFLREKLSTNRDELIAQLTDLEALRFELVEQRTRLFQILAEKKNQMLYPQEKGKTELDRRIMLGASVALIERDYIFLESLEGLVRDRLVLGEQLLSLP